MSRTRARRFLGTRLPSRRAASSGRPTILQQYGLTPEHIAGMQRAVREIKEERGEASYSLAVRRWASVDLDPEHPFQEWLTGRCSKHHLPKSLMNAIRPPAEPAGYANARTVWSASISPTAAIKGIQDVVDAQKDLEAATVREVARLRSLIFDMRQELYAMRRAVEKSTRSLPK